MKESMSTTEFCNKSKFILFDMRRLNKEYVIYDSEDRELIAILRAPTQSEVDQWKAELKSAEKRRSEASEDLSNNDQS